MSVISNNQLAGAAGQGGDVGYKIYRSLRFDSGSSSYLSRTPSSAGNRKTWTWSGWVKRAKLGSEQNIFGTDSALGLYFQFETSDKFRLLDYTGSAVNYQLRTTQVFRDPSAWLHVVFALDTTLATADDRIKLYINGEQITAFDNRNNPSQNYEGVVNSATAHTLGRLDNQYYVDGYLANIHFIDGVSGLSPTDFGEYDDNNVLQPKSYPGTYGTNGFHLDLSDNSSASNLGTDSSGNSNTWTVNNLSVASGSGNDSLIDTPTNYTASPNNGGNYATLNPLDGSPTGLSNGNLDAASANAYPTIIPGSGQWYYEVNGTGYTWDGTRADFTPRAGSHNFGQRVFSGTVPSGYKSICTTNLPDPTIADGSTAFDAKTFTGNHPTGQSITGLNFSPDFVWLKDRASGNWHYIFDAIRGTEKAVFSNATNAEGTYANTLTAFNSDGFTLGSDNATNQNGNGYVAWTWDAGSSTVSNTDGSITSSVRANPSAGFSIVTWSGTSANATIGHSLNAAPEFILLKQRDGSTGFYVYHSAVSPAKTLYLYGTTVAETYAAAYNNTASTSSVFSVGSAVATNSGNMLAYCFAPVAGYSAFGSYTGSSSTDGPFVYTGFRPAYILVKNSSIVDNWEIYDSSRSTYNATDHALRTDTSDAEYSHASNNRSFDILSNGFKVRGNNNGINGSGNTLIYASFAEHPFKTARAR